MVRRSERVKLGHTRQDMDCKDKEAMQNLCAANRKMEQCCGEHRRRLELFCQEDESFICVLCVPKHSSHGFVHLHEAISVYKDKLKTALTSLKSKVKHLKCLKIKQDKEVIDTQEDAFSLEQYIKQEFAKLHHFLQDKEQKLIEQLRNEEANMLTAMEENLEYIKRDIINSHVEVSNGDLEIKNKESPTLKDTEESSECIKNEVLAIQDTLFVSNLELVQQKTVGLLTVSESFEDVVVTFSDEEWKLLTKQDKDLYREVMVQNYEIMVSLGYNISPNVLSLLLKMDEELPNGDAEEKNSTEQKNDLEDNLHSTLRTDCGMSHSQQSLVGKPQLQHQRKKLTNHSQPLRSYDKLHSSPVPQVNLGHSCNEISKCGHGEPELNCLTENLQQCVQAVKDNDKHNLISAQQVHSECTNSKSSESDTRTHTEKKLYKCTECSKDFKYLSRLKTHYAIHTGNKPYKCAECSKCFTFLGNFRKHQAIHTGEKPYKCAECEKCFTQKGHLIHHQYSHTGNKPYKCTECSKCFTYLSSLQQHHAIHTGQKPFKCTECSKCFTRLRNLRQHLTIHTGNTPHKCAECGKCFTYLNSLQQHYAIHTGEKPYKCDKCNKCFTFLSNLRQHYVIHTGEKPYKCAECNKCFTQRGHLKHHQSSHTGTKPYKCTECTKCFTRLSNLQRHYTFHTGEKPHKCPECSKCFPHLNDLRQHSVVHAGEKPYKCSECSKCFTRLSSLRQHQILHIEVTKVLKNTTDAYNSKDNLKTALTSLESKVKELKYLQNKQEEEDTDIQQVGVYRAKIQNSGRVEEKNKKSTCFVMGDLSWKTTGARATYTLKWTAVPVNDHRLPCKRIAPPCNFNYVPKKLTKAVFEHAAETQIKFEMEICTAGSQKINKLKRDHQDFLTGNIFVWPRHNGSLQSASTNEERVTSLRRRVEPQRDDCDRFEPDRSIAVHVDSPKSTTIEPAPPVESNMGSSSHSAAGESLGKSDNIMGAAQIRLGADKRTSSTTIERSFERSTEHSILEGEGSLHNISVTSFSDSGARPKTMRGRQCFLEQFRLNDEEISVLNKGLTFVPAKTSVFNEVVADIALFCRNLALKTVYNNVSGKDLGNQANVLRQPSTFTPPFSPALNMFLKSCEKDLVQYFGSKEHNKYYNLTSQQQVALRGLCKNKNIVIKTADKGGAVVVLDTAFYSSKIKQLLSDNMTYIPINPIAVYRIPETFEDVVITFTEEEWKMLKKQDKELYREVMVQNYETMLSLGYKIPPMTLLLLLKEDDELTQNISEGKNTIEQKDSPEGTRSTECSASCIQHSSLGTSQLLFSAKNLQPKGNNNKLPLPSIPQLQSKNNCVKSSVCDTSQKTPTGKKLYKCTECSKCFIYPSDLRRHHALHSGEKPYKCAECGKCFTRKSHLEYHQNSHTGLKPYKCTECSKCFARKAYLEYHQYSHTQVKPYKCTECDKCFAQKSHLEYHQNSHRGVKPYKCTECNKSFANPHGLKIHHATHTGVKPYKCTECSMCFIQKSQLNYHKNSHTGMKPYKCNECSKCFTHHSTLRKHRVIHTGERPYKCTECDKCFTQPTGLRKHCVVHKGDVGKKMAR
ncbi:zinc finger protein 91-like [Protopterus annectens]|uniref:zinc finger protein 91-like n=1 Tax=Protopterus annectens TaxID=7888 RepID=UPI001CFC22A3|nr:zinc finger protein 91-like [Protopterus annectens]